MKNEEEKANVDISKNSGKGKQTKLGMKIMKTVRLAAQWDAAKYCPQMGTGPEGKEMSLGPWKNTYIPGQGVSLFISTHGQLQPENTGFHSGGHFNEKRMLQNAGRQTVKRFFWRQWVTIPTWTEVRKFRFQYQICDWGCVWEHLMLLQVWTSVWIYILHLQSISKHTPDKGNRYSWLPTQESRFKTSFPCHCPFL